MNSITAYREGNILTIPIKINSEQIGMKYDTGAGNTVISVEMFSEEITEEDYNNLRIYCELHGNNYSEFISASGDILNGYLIHAKNIQIDKVDFPDFYYYLIIGNKRPIALLGDDFIINCNAVQKEYGDITIHSFNFERYNENRLNAIQNEDLIDYIDELIAHH